MNKVAKDRAMREIPPPSNLRRVHTRKSSYPVDRVRLRSAIRAILLGTSAQQEQYLFIDGTGNAVAHMIPTLESYLHE